MSKLMSHKPRKMSLKIDGKTFSPERIARALVLQEVERDLTCKAFIKELGIEIEKVLAEESHGIEDCTY
jgi:hypothetical protein